jgi:hypothetical protein
LNIKSASTSGDLVGKFIHDVPLNRATRVSDATALAA